MHQIQNFENGLLKKKKKAYTIEVSLKLILKIKFKINRKHTHNRNMLHLTMLDAVFFSLDMFCIS